MWRSSAPYHRRHHRGVAGEGRQEGAGAGGGVRHIPFPFHGGVHLADQAQFDPMPLLDALIVELDERGGRLAQGVRVQTVSSPGDGLALHVRTADADEFDVTAKQCVLATGIPILDRGGFFARLKPSRSYCMACKVPGDITSGMYLSADSPTRSVRYAPTADGLRLIVGGAGHPVGHAKSPGVIGSGARLVGAAALPGCDADELVFGAGLLADRRAALRRSDPARERQDLRRNGFRQVGHDERHGRGARAVEPHPRRSDGLGGGFRQLESARAVGNSESHAAQPRSRAVPRQGMDRAGDRTPDDGGVVSGPPWHLEARSVVNGVEHRVSPVCPHLGGIVHWNDADESWECPLHGSRFAPDGTLLGGPATRDLTRAQ